MSEDVIMLAGGAPLGTHVDEAIFTARRLAAVCRREGPRALLGQHLTPFTSLYATQRRNTTGAPIVAFVHNGVEVRCHPGSDVFGLIRDYRRAADGEIVGPCPPEWLTSDQIMADLRAALRREAAAEARGI